MNDDELRDALDRRSRGAQFRADELLPGVRRGIGVRPQPARVARWAPLAGLAAAAVIVLAIVIAFPRSSIGNGPLPPAATTTPIECADLNEPGVSIAWSGHPTILDATGLVASCARIEAADLPLGASNPEGDLTKLDIVWSGLSCDIDPLFDFTALATGTGARAYSMVGSIATHRCTSPQGEHAMSVKLNSPIDADGMPVRVDDFSWPPDSGPTPSAAPLPSGLISRQLNCGNDMTLMDGTGAVASCASQTGFGPEVGVAISVTQITAQWLGGMCQPVVTASLDQSGDGYTLSINQSSEPYPSAAPSCAGGVITRTLTLSLNAPIGGRVDATVNGQELAATSAPLATPISTAAVLDCGVPDLPDLPITVTDHAGLLTGCAAELVPGASDQQPAVVANGSDLQLSFGGQGSCGLSDVAIDLWHPGATDVHPYSLQVAQNSRDQLDYPATCGTDGTNFVLDFTLAHDIAQEEVDAFATYERGGQATDSESSAIQGTNEFDLDLATDSANYNANDVIHPTAHITYYGDAQQISLWTDRAFDLVGPWYVEQLDGDLSIGNGASLLMPECDQLTNKATRQFDYVKPLSPGSGLLVDPRLKTLYNGPDLQLPAGTWRISVSSSFSIGCSSDTGSNGRVLMSASVIVQVH